MAKAPEDAKQTDLIDMLHGVDDEPQRFDLLMESWNTLFESREHSQGYVFAEIEQAARGSVASMNDVAPQTPVGRQVGQLLEQFGSPAFLVREKGQILAQNTAALQAYGTALATSLDELPFALEMDVPVADVVRSSLDPSRNLHDAILKRGYADADDAPITLSIAPSKPMVDGVGEALVFVVDARWKTEAAGLIKREFDLTKAERELLVAFLDGQTTQDMACTRERSHATVKTQFKSLMTKMGARSQTELFRNALSVSQFVDKVGEIAKVLRHPHRKRVDILRPGGRSVEVTMAGDLTGKPLVFLQTTFDYTFESHIEQAFYDAAFCALSICRPGYGDTDPALPGEEYIETFCGDIEAVLDQLGHSKCMLLSQKDSCATMYFVSKRLEARITGLIQVAACGPPKYFSIGRMTTPWIKGFLRASDKTPMLGQFLIRSAFRVIALMGSSRFMQQQFKDDPLELANLSRPSALVETQAGFDTAFRQNYSAPIADLTYSLSDFSNAIGETDLPILVINGVLDQVFLIEGIRAFVGDYAHRMTLIELPDAGFCALATHTDIIVKHMSAFYETHS